MPAFVDDGNQPPFQPILVAVVGSHGLVIGQGIATPDDPDSGVEQALQQAIAATGHGIDGRSSLTAITITTPELRPVVERLLPHIPIQVGPSADLEELFSSLPAMDADGDAEGNSGGLMGLQSLLAGDICAQDAASFFAACKPLYERQPWRPFIHEQCLFTITSQALGMRRWCGCVIGQAAQSYGVLLFPSLEDQGRFIEAAMLASQIGGPPVGLFPHQWAISFEPLDAISRSLADEIAAHGWPVAAGDGYPVPLHVDPDLIHRPLKRADLARLEAVARALTRLIDNVPDLEAFWNGSGQTPLRRQYRLPVQDRGPVSVSITLIPPENDDDEP